MPTLLDVPSKSDTTTSAREYPSGYILEGWLIHKTIGRGTYGTVYEVGRLSKRTNQSFALKTVSFEAAVPELKNEINSLRIFHESGSKHCCSVIEAGKHHGLHYVVMSLVGKTVQYLRQSMRSNPTKKFSLGCSLKLGKECLEAISDLHSVGIIHCDVKPSNFAIGANDPRRIYILDFGMSRKHRSNRRQKHFFRWMVGFRGTPRYASLDAHKNLVLCPKDDVESWFYQQIELTTGTLLWKSLKDNGDIIETKKKCRIELLPKFLTGCPPEYHKILTYIDELKYNQQPDYFKIQKLLDEAIKRNAYNIDTPFDWETNHENDK
ncbi:unnamed protein product [Auanema sp. JU1783]|nr:unnamed protein product [Auanema sp. JU1783]